MYIKSFLWLPRIIEKLESKHRVSQDEAEEVFFNGPKYRFVESGHRPGEARMYTQHRDKRTLAAI